MVIVGHAYHLLGRSAEVPFLLGYPISTFGVVIFFSISGYLITRSWATKRDVVSYSAARLLRILPGLIAVVLVSAFVIGPLVTTHRVDRYLTDPLTYDYLSNIWMKPNYLLPGVWFDLPYPIAVNGSLWTLPAEFFCYIVVPLVCVRLLWLRAGVVAGLLALSIWLSLHPITGHEVIYGSRLTDAASMWVFFAAGALVATAEERWGPRIFRTDAAVAVFSVFLLLLSLRPAWMPYFGCLTLPYVVLVVGRASTPYVRRASRFGDFSYGLYLWGFVVQQAVVDAFGVRRMALDLPVVLAISMGVAVLSWHLIEQPSLRLKSRITRERRAQGAAAPVPEPSTVGS
jgi:peptidoglycan/LPS O-acetylase OafA/YrhL